jgi:hypothetical protein
MPLPGSRFENLHPEPIEKSVRESIHRLMKNGIAHGDFSKQLQYATL